MSVAPVDDPRVSRTHLRIIWDPEGWTAESVGRAGTWVGGRAIARLRLTGVVEVRLAAPDGPLVRFEATGDTALTSATTVWADEPARAGAPEPVGHPGGQPRKPRALTRADLRHALDILVPLRSWLKDPDLRRWYRLLVAVYGLTPLVFLVVFRHTTNLQTLGWAYCLYIAPLWALVFWYLIRPGRIQRQHVVVAAVIVAAELVLIPAMTLPWERALAPNLTNHDLAPWIFGVGFAEELTKDLPVLVLAFLLLRTKGTKFDPRMWMFLATLSGLIFGAYEASKVYVPLALVTIARGQAVGILEFTERVFVDGFQHALWAGIAGFFVGLGTNYRRQRIPLWIFGVSLPALLHGLNDWSLSGVFGADDLPWILIQAFSLFLFLGYSASAPLIEGGVRHATIFRGESIYQDPSFLNRPPHEQH